MLTNTAILLFILMTVEMRLTNRRTGARLISMNNSEFKLMLFDMVLNKDCILFVGALSVIDSAICLM